MNEGWISSILGGGALALAAYFAFRPKTELSSAVKAATLSTASTSRPLDQLQILTGDQLIVKFELQPLVQIIRDRMGLARENFERDAMVLIHAYAEFVQQLPASESHHHAQPGGLLSHTLEVVCYALTLRQGYKLPQGATAEDQARLAAVWSYAVLVAAFLHDIGKPLSDVRVTLYGKDERNALGLWQAFASPMGKVLGATHYAVEFPASRDYAAHQRLSVAMLHAMVPATSLQWLGLDVNLMPQLIAYLDGKEETSPIKDIISKADSQSVSLNLKVGSRVRFSKAQQVPLIERLMHGLRALVQEGQLAVNRPGAAMYIDPDQTHVWLVSAAVADKVRALLNEREIRHAGAAGIPTDNTRFFDTWQEYGALITPDKPFGKGSVWWVRFQIGEWSQVLTVLKFPIALLWPEGKVRPAALVGSITPVEPSSREEREHAVVQVAEPKVWQEDGDSPATPTADAGAMQVDASPISSESTSAPLAASPPIAAPVDDGFLEAAETAATVVASSKPQSKHAVQAFVQSNTAPPPKNKSNGSEAKPNAERFMAWIQQGLGDGSLTYNESDAVVHFTAQGMALVTPKVFKLYLECHSYEGDLGQSKSPFHALQRDVQKGGYIQRNRLNKSSFFKYQVMQSNGEVGIATITTYVVPNPQAYIRPVPSPNPLLVFVAESSDKTGATDKSDVQKASA